MRIIENLISNNQHGHAHIARTRTHARTHRIHRMYINLKTPFARVARRRSVVPRVATTSERSLTAAAPALTFVYVCPNQTRSAHNARHPARTPDSGHAAAI